MAYCIYLRKSRADKELEVLEDVLKRHEDILSELAKSRGYNITKIFREVVSGETLAARPEMQRLLYEVENGLWEGVLVMEVERLARGNSIDQGIVSQAFKLSDTLIITPSKIYDPSNEFDEEYFEFGLFMSRREYKTINRRLSLGRLASCREGKFVGSVAPYGYKKEKLMGQKGWTLVPDENEAEIVRLIYRLYLSNEENTGFGGIANKLNLSGIYTRNGNLWGAVQIKYILTNDVYIGKIHWQKTPEIKRSENGSIIKARSKSDNYYIFDGIHKPLIDGETFTKVKQIIDSRIKTPKTKSRPLQNPFAGILVCSVCGRPMKRRPADPRRPGRSASFECPTRGCPTVGCSVDIVERKVLSAIKYWLGKYEIKAVNIKDDSPINNEAAIKGLKKRLKRLQKQLESAYSFFEQGIYDKDVFLNRQTNLKKEISAVKKSIENLQEENQRPNKTKVPLPRLKNIYNTYYTLTDIKSKNELIKTLFHKIVYTKTSKGSSRKKPDAFELEFFSKLPKS